MGLSALAAEVADRPWLLGDFVRVLEIAPVTLRELAGHRIAA
jgi:hypothetical protein